MLLAIALMAQHATGELNYSEVRSLASEHKRLLSAEEGTQIQRAFTEAMSSALPQCVATVRPTCQLTSLWCCPWIARPKSSEPGQRMMMRSQNALSGN